MESNVINFTPCAGQTVSKRECVHFLITMRRDARTAMSEIAQLADENHSDRRTARKHRASGNAVLIRNAEVIESRIADRSTDLNLWKEILLHIGAAVRGFSEDIDRLIPRDELFEILGVNRADRARVGAKAGIKEIVLVHGLEDSATHRGSEFKDGPLFEALNHYMMRMIDTTPELQKIVNDGLFGKGGMFEFIPTYSRSETGEFKRNPPKLRLADAAIDAKGRA